MILRSFSSLHDHSGTSKPHSSRGERSSYRAPPAPQAPRLPTPPAPPSRRRDDRGELQHQVGRMAQQIQSQWAANRQHAHPSSHSDGQNVNGDRQPPQNLVVPYVEIFQNQRARPHAVDLQQVHRLAKTHMELSDATDPLKYSFPQQFAHAVLASGTRDACVEMHAAVTEISDGVHQMLYIPWRGEERLPFGHTTPPSSTYDYTCTHGTDVQSAGLIMLEDFVLVSATPSRISKKKFRLLLCTALPRRGLPEQTIHIMADNATRRSKGQHGVRI